MDFVRSGLGNKFHSQPHKIIQKKIITAPVNLLSVTRYKQSDRKVDTMNFMNYVSPRTSTGKFMKTRIREVDERKKINSLKSIPAMRNLSSAG